MGVHKALPDADDQRCRLIVAWHAQGHDKLDELGVPRFADGMEYTIAERIECLRVDTRDASAAVAALALLLNAKTDSEREEAARRGWAVIDRIAAAGDMANISRRGS